MRTPLIFISLFIFSCQNHKNNKPPISKPSYTPAIDLKIKLPAYYYNLSKGLLLPDINHGTDSFELRIWESLVITDIKTVTILNYSNNKWDLHEIRYWVSHKNSDSAIRVDSSKTYEIIPQLSYRSIYDSIRNFRLDKLPYQPDIPNFVSRTADGYSYFIEIAEKNSYKTLWYVNPDSYEDTSNKQVANFINFLKRHHLEVSFP